MAVCGPVSSSPTGSGRPAAAQRTALRELQATRCMDLRASRARAPVEALGRLDRAHDLESEAGPSFTWLLAENRREFGSKCDSLLVGGSQLQRFAAAGLPPLALIETAVGRLPGTMSASALRCVSRCRRVTIIHTFKNLRTTTNLFQSFSHYLPRGWGWAGCLLQWQQNAT